MSDLTDDILAGVDIIDIVSRYVNLKKVGKNFVGICPFHNEKTPSFTVAQDKQIFKCFGCGAGGNAIKFLMDIERLEFWDAIKILAKDANVDISKYQFKDQNEESSVKGKEKIKLMNKKTQKFFAENLSKSDFALKYLKQDRKLSDKDIKDWEIGFAPDSHYELVKYLKDQGFSDDDILQASLGKKGATSDIYSFFRNRIIFPIHDHMGNIVSFAGRALSKEDKPKYLNTTETPVYDKSKVLYGLNIAKNHIKEFDKLIVVEGYMDVIALARAEIPVGIASCGTALTFGHMALAKRYSQNIVFLFDNDDAGFEATLRGLKTAYQYDIYPRIFELPKQYKDIDEMLNATDKHKILEELENLKDGMDFVFDRIGQKYNIGFPSQRTQVINLIFDILINIKNNSIFLFYLEKTAKFLSIDYNVLFKQFKTYLVDVSRHQNISKKSEKSDGKEDEGFLLGALLYKDFLQQNEVKTDLLNKYVELFNNISQYFQDSILGKTLSGSLSQDEKAKLLESQLWWEKQIDTLSKDKKQQIIVNFMKLQIHGFMRIIVKTKEISDKQKDILIDAIKKLIKI